ncbi:zinc metalloproteinase nas-1-like [Scaptodrosophila lebanonensis]|uniref:Metalloendopeptidase n=1 Tax=Drosophila lebanonensis TaxID=7225 RepID=A0A6J2T4E3_DROLE|nr:zinc metalloproteinase nas-1 [Scaptodrosophila lebanonensis]XP_030371796.1 zinc metalloproteinase nas-1-like [Scaptodrosophila lebanonensis]
MIRLILVLTFTLALAEAVPLISYDDIDDTEVIELPDNAIDAAEAPASKDIIDLSAYGSALFGTPDQELTAALVANYSAENAINPEELGTYLEGDILMPGQYIRNGLTTQSSRWPKGVVPYEIRGNFNSRDRTTIENAIAQYHRRTCIRFVPRSIERDYISIVSGNSGCWSSVGRVGGKQEVNLQSPGCLGRPGTAIHELMHALGFLHEQNRMERDGFVAIQYQNVQPSAKSNFDKAARTEAFGVPYDYGSVMHYSANAFSTNGQPTIVAVRAGGSSKMGQRDGFSDYDVEKLNKMYDCGYQPTLPGAVAPVPIPAPAPAPAPVAGSGNPIVESFLGGLISGLGLGDENENKPSQ